MDINSSTLRSLFTGLSLAFNARLGSVQTFWNTVAMPVPSSTAMNEYPRLDDLPGIREWIGDRRVHDLSVQTYVIRNRSFENTIGVLRENIEDDQLGVYSNIAAQMGQDAGQFPDLQIFPLLKKGNVTKCYDGQYFFDTDHPGYDENGGATTVSNFTDGAGPAWYLVDDTQVIKPMVWQTRKPFNLVPLQNANDPNVFFNRKFIFGVDGRCNAGFGLWQLAYMSKAALTADNYAAARAAMMSIRKRSGEILNIRPTKLLVPASLEGTARTIVEAALINGGETNVWAKTAEVVVIPYLA
ncbi:Mu-like prophage major head subunit gpT family protein [Rhizobium mayense]|uniref:Mu-like prophage major head subunit gpT family protein n=1 Tax=Rhizobium mayense TaxID=1312184 RepID=A0ABT7JY77_9HYPH|nr:Mu-like prophage major head subunit gpT family protein [Rhizobium mayense]MDL2401257.1 Mu-like prophage major head subunit gpT family protein [Rhizobium mayense]